jgi:hypothetical protein
MDLTKILAIAGKPGLYNMIAQTKSGVIVESLIDKKRFPAFSHDRISSLAEISIFTTDEDLPLKDILKKVFEKYDGGPAISNKATNNELKAFMEEILPTYDKERVYVSDIKKLVVWYNLLQEHGMLDFTEEENTDVAKETTDATDATEAPEASTVLPETKEE